MYIYSPPYPCTYAHIFNWYEFAILFIYLNGKRKLICNKDACAMYDPRIIRRRVINQNGNNYKCCLTRQTIRKMSKYHNSSRQTLVILCSPVYVRMFDTKMHFSSILQICNLSQHLYIILTICIQMSIYHKTPCKPRTDLYLGRS